MTKEDDMFELNVDEFSNKITKFKAIDFQREVFLKRHNIRNVDTFELTLLREAQEEIDALKGIAATLVLKILPSVGDKS